MNKQQEIARALRANGKSYAAIAGELNRQGFRTVRGFRHQLSSVQHLLGYKKPSRRRRRSRVKQVAAISPVKSTLEQRLVEYEAREATIKAVCKLQTDPEQRMAHIELILG